MLTNDDGGKPRWKSPRDDLLIFAAGVVLVPVAVAILLEDAHSVRARTLFLLLLGLGFVLFGVVRLIRYWVRGLRGRR